MTAPLCIVVDFPWQFGDSLPGKTRGAAKRYACMRSADMPAMLLGAMADARDVVCFCWRVAAMQREALNVLDACGLTVKSELVWEKLTKNGLPHFGMGRYTRAAHEVCLIAVRGRAFPEVRNVRSRFAAPVREHSRKPEEFYAIVEAMYPSSRKVELFARTVRAGWEQQGLELGMWEAAQ